jgi:putative tryptophan/tyrosine transport system substrate-binding protein
MLKRRRFIMLAAGAAAVWPGCLRAQAQAKHRLGLLLYSDPTADPQVRAVLRALAALGYVEGGNLVVEYRFAEGREERLPALAADLVALRPDAIFALGGDVAPAATKATAAIPVVFMSSADPERAGMVASLARPGRNATGVTLLQDELASKRLEFLKEAAPRIANVAFVWNPDHPDNELRDAQHAADALGVRLHPVPVRGPDDIDVAFAAVRQAAADAMYVVSSRHTVLNMGRIGDFAATGGLPLAGGWGAWARTGGLLSYGPNVGEMTRRAIGQVDKILRGAKPAELPVEQPTSFELVINRKRASALGLTIPPSLLARADEVID